jgi:hypothetical protein
MKPDRLSTARASQTVLRMNSRAASPMADGVEDDIDMRLDDRVGGVGAFTVTPRKPRSPLAQEAVVHHFDRRTIQRNPIVRFLARVKRGQVCRVDFDDDDAVA